MHRVIFQNCAESVIAFVESSRHSLLVGMCWFTHPKIFLSIQKACYRKVRVKILLNFDHINFNPQGLHFQELEKAGAEVLGYTGPGLLHYKFAVSDEQFVLSGSYNWTRSEQCEHMALLNDGGLAAQFIAVHGIMAEKCLPLAQLRKMQPRHISFSQLYRPALWSAHDLRKRVVAGAKTWVLTAKTAEDWNSWVSSQRHCLTSKYLSGTWPVSDILEEGSFRNWVETATLQPGIKTLLRRYGLQVQIGDVFIAISSKGRLLGAGIVGSCPEILAAQPGVVSHHVQWLDLKEPNAVFMGNRPIPKSGFSRFKGSAMSLIADIERDS